MLTYKTVNDNQLISASRTLDELPAVVAAGIADENVLVDEDDQTPETEQDLALEYQFYTEQIYRIIKPVIACIVLSVLWVKLSLLGGANQTLPSTYTVFQPSAGGSTSGHFFGSLANAAIIIGPIIVATILVVFLFKKGYFKVLFGFFILVVAFLLGFMGYLLVA